LRGGFIEGGFASPFRLRYRSPASTGRAEPVEASLVSWRWEVLGSGAGQPRLGTHNTSALETSKGFDRLSPNGQEEASIPQPER